MDCDEVCEISPKINSEPFIVKETDESGTNESSDNAADSDEHVNNDDGFGPNFKKPVLLIGPRKGAHKFSNIKIIDPEPSLDEDKEEVVAPQQDMKKKSNKGSPAETIQERRIPLPYKEPSWALRPDREYSLEVLKEGKIIENYNLSDSFFVFGRSSVANCVMAHNSVSRFHAVLQYGKEEGDEKPGFYLYDLNSTSGTFLNKNQIKPDLYVKIQVGHMIKLAMSTRMFILKGPSDDKEPESELTVSQMKDIRLKQKLAAQLEAGQDRIPKEDEGIDWGMGDDAEEETDLSVNPFAAAPNEELYIDDPKKTLRGWFEREGCELDYDCQEKGYGQFVCRIQLPIEETVGKAMVAEAVVKGKKKEAVIQCALEACRILDQYGLLRQSKHESRKKKVKDWEANDFYDSDEDSFLDRTGTVERKRQKRMEEAGVAQVVHTYPGLMAEHKRLVEEVERVTSSLAEVSAPQTQSSKPAEEDELDQYMAGLIAVGIDKAKISSLKAELIRLKQDEHRIRTLANIARPSGTPELLQPWPSEAVSVPSSKPKQPPMIGKRRALLKKPAVTVKKVEAPPKKPANDEEEDEEEFDSD